MPPLRRAVRILVLSVLWLSPAAARADPLDRWAPEIALASARFAVPQSWIRAVIRAESGGRIAVHGRPIVSRAGAVGLMQLMPGTWRDMRALLGLGPDPQDAADNILAGTFYLRLMYDRFGYPGLFAAYNAGPARYSASLSRALALPAETRAYVAAVTGAPRSVPKRLEPAAGLFALRRSATPPAGGGSAPGGSPLFVVLAGAAAR